MPTPGDLSDSTKRELVARFATHFPHLMGPSPDLYCPHCDVFFACNDEHTTCPGSPTQHKEI